MIIETFLSFMQKVMLFSSYINSTSSFPKPLSREDEQKLFEEYVKTKDVKIKERLIHHNLRLVVHVVKKYNQSEEADDLISVGSLGLIKAINSYDMDNGTQFSTYAARCIENEILMLIRANKKHKSNLSIEDVLGRDDEENEITIGDLNYDDNVNVEMLVEHDDLSKKLRRLLKESLTSREFEIICMRYGLFGNVPLPQREVAKKLGISRSYISRLEKKSIDVLRKNINKKDYGINFN